MERKSGKDSEMCFEVDPQRDAIVLGNLAMASSEAERRDIGALRFYLKLSGRDPRNTYSHLSPDGHKKTPEP